MFDFIRRDKKHHLNRLVIESGMTLREFAQSDISPEFDNCQTRMISGRAEVQFVTGTEACGPVDLDRAQANLGRDSRLVCVTEGSGKGLLALYHLFGRTSSPKPRLKVTGGRPDTRALDPFSRSLLGERSRIDPDLHEYGRKRFDRHGSSISMTRRMEWRLSAMVRG